MSAREEPQLEVSIGGTQVTLLGTAHISKTSAEQVRRLIDSGEYDAVAVELCRNRFTALTDPRALSQLDLFSVIRSGRAYMVVANLALSAYQQRLADQLHIEPGAEQRTAIRLAKELGLEILLVDREIGVTLRRISARLGWWKRYTLFAGIFAALVTSDEVSEEEIEQLKRGDVLETAFAELAQDRHDLFTPLIVERDRYMAARLRAEAEKDLAGGKPRRILAVVGVGHLKGIAEHLQHDDEPPRAVLAELEQVPAPSRIPNLIPWIILTLVLGGFAWGFVKSPELGWELVGTWTLITGGLCALGTIVSGGHPLTVVAGFFAAPLTALHPAIGAGMVTGAVELTLRKPRVGDFSRLREDVAHLGGWWRNRVARVFVVFMLSTLGAAIGTYIAGFTIAERLMQ